MNFLGQGIESPAGKALALEIMDFMREVIVGYQEETGYLFNLEATPAESTSYRLARLDKAEFPDIITSGDQEPYYTNSTQLPVDYTSDVIAALVHQDDLQVKYTGGTVFHAYLGKGSPTPTAAASFCSGLPPTAACPTSPSRPPSASAASTAIWPASTGAVQLAGKPRSGAGSSAITGR